MQPAPARDAAAAASVDRSTSQRGRFDSSRPPCRFFLLGKCKFGDSCTFSHDPRDERLPVCSFFEKTGSCRYGSECKFLHGDGGNDNEVRAASTTTTSLLAAGAPAGGAASAQHVHEGTRSAGAGSSTPASGASGGNDKSTPAMGEEQLNLAEMDSAEDKCGICLENIPASGKRFGLLNCDHVYCLECLRMWRKSKGPQKDISRTCPECRKVSFFLVPSKEHLKGKAKAKAIQAYKKGLSKLPCKYHKPDTNVCPFGPRCFYAHLDENGNDVKDRAPPAPPAPSRRACPYLRGAGSSWASRGGSRSGGGGGGGGDAGHGRGASSRIFSDVHVLYPFPEDGDTAGFSPIMEESRERDQMSVIMRLQRLMLDAAEDY